MTMDLARIEILKGPQGILFGKNTIGGAVNVTTAKPTDEFEGSVDALYSPDDGEQIYNLVVNAPLTDTVAARLAMRYEGMDGWWDNRALNTDGPDKDNLFTRLSLRWDAADNIEVLAKAEIGDFEVIDKPAVVYQSDFVGNQNAAGNTPYPFTSEHGEGAFDRRAGNETETETFALTVNWDLDIGTFTAISAYSAYDLIQTQDSDYSTEPGLHRTLDEEYDQFSQEIRLVSPGGETLDWIVGAYYQQSDLNIQRTNDALYFGLLGPLAVAPLYYLPGQPVIPSQFDQESNSWAVFAQGTWAVTDTLRFGLGLRYNEESKDLDKRMINHVGVRLGDLVVYANPATRRLIADLRSHEFLGLTRDEEKVTWMANVQWDATDNMMVYATASTGFKGGGFDEAYSGAGTSIRLASPFTGVPTGEIVAGADPSVLEYEEETVESIEIGAKMSLLDGAAELNIALFRSEYDDLQVSSLVGDTFRVGNAGKAKSQGLEVDGRWLLSEGLTVGASVAWLDASYDEFNGATCTIPQAQNPAENPGCISDATGENITAARQPGGQNLSGESLLFAPDVSANLNIEYVMPVGDELELRTNLDLNYTDGFNSALDLDPNTYHDGYTKVNLRIGLATVDDTWSVALIGKNLTDKETRVWNNDVPVTNSNSYFGIPERPRSIAIQGRYRF
jgi:outer membrane receptor protein involved in Fe transport